LRAGQPGEVVPVSGDGVIVAAPGGGILVKRVRAKGGDRQPAQEYAPASGLNVGGQLG